jgi:hypothetical protein
MVSVNDVFAGPTRQIQLKLEGKEVRLRPLNLVDACVAFNFTFSSGPELGAESGIATFKTPHG